MKNLPIKAMSQKEIKASFKRINEMHKTWHKFYNFLVKKYGKELYEKPTIHTVGKKKIKLENFNEYEFSKLLVGYDVMTAIEKYAKRNPEIRIVYCDDALHAGSDIVLVPHPKHGITMLFIPQCTGIQNQMFLYENHYKNLLKTLKEMKDVYKGSGI